MHAACDKGHKEIAGMLLEKQAVLYTNMSGGSTPMSLAAKHGHQEIINILDEAARIHEDDH